MFLEDYEAMKFDLINNYCYSNLKCLKEVLQLKNKEKNLKEK